MDDRETPPKGETDKTERVTIGIEESRAGEIAAVSFMDGYRCAIRDMVMYSVIFFGILALFNLYTGEKS